jgi:hypothetical protein
MTIAQVDERIAQIEAKLPELEVAATTAESEKQTHDAEVDALALDAHLGDDVARTRLEAHDERDRQLARAVRLAQSALRSARERLGDLQKAKANAERRLKEDALGRAAADQVRLGAAIDADLDTLLARIAQWMDLGLQVYQANNELNRTGGRTPRATLASLVQARFRPLAPQFFEAPSVPGLHFQHVNAHLVPAAAQSAEGRAEKGGDTPTRRGSR